MTTVNPRLRYITDQGTLTTQGIQLFEAILRDIAAGGGGGGSSVWGGITGTLSDQVDLAAVLAAKADTAALTSGLAGKANTSHTHAQSDVTGLVTALAGKQATILAGTATVTANGYEVTQTVTATGVTASSRVFVSLGAMADADENDPEMLDILSLAAVPGTDQITFDMAFDTPQAGAIPVNWSVI